MDLRRPRSLALLSSGLLSPGLLPRVGVALVTLTALGCSGAAEDEAPTQAPHSEVSEVARAGGLAAAVLPAGDSFEGRLAAALATDPKDPSHAALVGALREHDGPAGLDEIIRRYRAPERQTRAVGSASEASWRALIDAVAQQRDAHYGGMYWERDLERAQSRARAEGKPILSLRLLGELTSEYSCANSRLFRTVLYADPDLAAWLEDRFVLHWSSERPVPKLAIDFGDGRVVRRTLTGNSAHFVLDADGRTLDVIPGLWSAPRFRGALEQSLGLAESLQSLESLEGDSSARHSELIAEHHQRRFDAAAADLHTQLSALRQAPVDLGATKAWLAQAPGDADGDGRVPAKIAVPMAVGKSRMEAPILGAAPRQLGNAGPGKLGTLDQGAAAPMTASERLRLGEGMAGVDALHPNTLAILRAERPVDGLVQAAGARVELEVLMAEALVASIQEDTAKNALELYPRIHAELARRARAEAPMDFAGVDAWLYAELFQTPAGDPWLGLIDPEVYTGLVLGGVEGVGPRG